MSTNNFLKAFQLHIFKYGVPSSCFSDLGSNLVAGADILKSYFSDYEIKSYFENS